MGRGLGIFATRGLERPKPGRLPRRGAASCSWRLYFGEDSTGDCNAFVVVVGKDAGVDLEKSVALQDVEAGFWGPHGFIAEAVDAGSDEAVGDCVAFRLAARVGVASRAD